MDNTCIYNRLLNTNDVFIKKKHFLFGLNQKKRRSQLQRQNQTCSSLINCWSLSLSTGPCRPPLLGLINTTIGARGAISATPPPGRSKWSGIAVASFLLIQSRMAKRRYSGINSLWRSSSLSTPTHVRLASPQPLIAAVESTVDDRAATNFSVVASIKPKKGEYFSCCDWWKWRIFETQINQKLDFDDWFFFSLSCGFKSTNLHWPVCLFFRFYILFFSPEMLNFEDSEENV